MNEVVGGKKPGLFATRDVSSLLTETHETPATSSSGRSARGSSLRWVWVPSSGPASLW